MNGNINRQRHFRVYDEYGALLGVEGWHGCFVGRTPRQAASKAFTRLMKHKEYQNEHDENEHVTFYIKEITRGSKRQYKKYGYSGKRITLDNPREVDIGRGNYRRTIKYKHKNKIARLRDVNFDL